MRLVEMIKLELRTLSMHIDGILQDKFGVGPRWVIVSGKEVHECAWVFRGNADAFLEYVGATRFRISGWSVKRFGKNAWSKDDILKM